MAIIPLPPQKRPQRRLSMPHLSRPAIALLSFAVLVIGFITWQIISSSSRGGVEDAGGTGNLVQLGTGDESDTDAPDEPDSLPDGYQEYYSDDLGFSFIYPEAWGKLDDSKVPGSTLSVKTAKISSFGLSESLEVEAYETEKFQIAADDAGTVITPKQNSAGQYDWIVTDRGKGKAGVGRPYEPQPKVAYKSGKATVYTFLSSKDNCVYSTQVFPAGENFVKVRLPSFCVSDKPGDESIQADRKASFDVVRDTMLRSITVL